MSYLHLGPISGNRKRRLGLTAQTPWRGHLLIMHNLPLDDVSHNPVSSSDERLSETSDGASDDWEPSSNKFGTSVEASTPKSGRGRHTLGSSPRPDLDVDKSNIPSTSFFSGSSSSAPPGGQSFKRPFQAMNDGAVDEDERTELWGSKKPKMKKLYGQGRGIEIIRGSQAVSQGERTRKSKDSSRAGRSKPKAQVKGGLPLQRKPSENHGRPKLIYGCCLHSR